MNKVLCTSAVLVLLAALCTGDQQNTRIYSGEDAEAGEYPFIVLHKYNEIFNLTEDGSAVPSDYWWQCAGSILSSRIILTAAHCVVWDVYPDDGNYTELTLLVPRNQLIIAGLTNKSSTDGTDQEVHVSGIIVHPEYNNYVWGTDGETIGDNDIAMLITDTDITFGTYAAAISLPEDEDIASLNAEGAAITVIGWGVDETNSLQENLQEVAYVVTSPANCEATWGSKITPGMMCTGASPDVEFEHAGSGDSGGPLFTKVNGTWTLLALTAWGEYHGKFTNVSYDVNTNVSYYKSWIEANMAIALTDYISTLTATNDTQTVTYSNIRHLLYKTITITPADSDRYTQITVKSGSLLEYDFVQIYDGNNVVTDEMLVEFTNGTLDVELTFTASTTNGLTVVITTGQYNQSQGFTMEFEQVAEAGNSMDLVCADHYFACLDNFYCVPESSVCSGTGHCNDVSDEAQCEEEDEDEEEDDGSAATQQTASPLLSALTVIVMSYLFN